MKLSTGLILASALSSTAFAVPSIIGLGDFSGSETVINFNILVNEELISNQYAAQGVSFIGGLYGMTNPGDTSQFPGNGGGVIASNWLYSQGRHDGLSFDVVFSSTQTRVGFWAETNDADDTTISVYSGATLLGSVMFDTAISAVFIGVEDPAGFNNLTISVNNQANGFLAIDDLRFENAGQQLPEAGMTLASLSAAVGALLVFRRKNS